MAFALPTRSNLLCVNFLCRDGYRLMGGTSHEVLYANWTVSSKYKEHAIQYLSTPAVQVGCHSVAERHTP